MSEAFFDRAVGSGLEPSVYATEWGAGLALRPAGGIRARQSRRAADAAGASVPPESFGWSPSFI